MEIRTTERLIDETIRDLCELIQKKIKSDCQGDQLEVPSLVESLSKLLYASGQF